MAMTPEQAKQQEDDFAAGYAEDQQKPADMSDDEAFGLTEPAPAETQEQEAAEPVAEEAAETPVEEASEQAAGAEGGGEGDTGNDQGGEMVAPVAEDAAESTNVAESEPMDQKDKDREKSWEGRLRAKEAELKAREEALKAAEGKTATEAPQADAAEPTPEAAEPAAEEVSEPAANEKIEEVASQVESGQLTAEQAMATLTNDFGEDFTKMLGVLIEAKAAEIAGKTADEKVGAVGSKLDGLIGELVDDKAKSHFESISDAHPDFMEIGESPEFKEYVDALPATEKERAMEIISKGSARQISKLLDSYKKSKAPAEVDTPDESAMDAAEGVRGKALKLPDAPTKSEGYEEAWDKF